jgi:hypothetical protein
VIDNATLEEHAEEHPNDEEMRMEENTSPIGEWKPDTPIIGNSPADRQDGSYSSYS